ncbi:MAG: CRISPR-associated endoribonuclease Cas6 [Sarcina sp.]
MKISITGKMKEQKIGIGYRMFVLSMIKKVISDYDKDYFEDMFFYEGKKSKKIKPFTFSVFFRDYKINQDFIEVNGDVKIIISSADMKLNMILFNGFMGFNTHGDFIKSGVKIEKDRKIEDREVVMKTLSPIYLKGKDGKDLDITDESYNIEFNYFADLILRSYRGYGLNEKLEFIPLNMKKVVAKEEIGGFKDKTGKRFIYIKAYSGVFKLLGNTEDLNLLKELGVGARRSGFGTIDIF